MGGFRAQCYFWQRWVTGTIGARLGDREHSHGVLSVVGRGAELVRLDDFARGGRPGSSIVLIGAPGIGKTTLWEAALHSARERGKCVLAARPSESRGQPRSLLRRPGPTQSHRMRHDVPKLPRHQHSQPSAHRIKRHGTELLRRAAGDLIPGSSEAASAPLASPPSERQISRSASRTASSPLRL
jgi:hypothetical protein